jgi:hypothetical protein
MNPDLFRNSDNWLGCYYELCLELGASSDDEVLLCALSAIWSQPQLQGPWIDRKRPGSRRSGFDVVEGAVAPHYGVLTIDGSEFGCVTHVVRETDGSDWLDLCVPSSMLQLAFDVRYPLNCEPNPWMATVDSVFLKIAASVFAECPYRLAIIGEEASGITNANSITTSDIKRGVFLLPDHLIELLGVKSQACRCTEGLWKVGDVRY